MSILVFLAASVIVLLTVYGPKAIASGARELFGAAVGSAWPVSWRTLALAIAAAMLFLSLILSAPAPPPSPVASASYVLKGTRAEVYDAVRAFQKANGLEVDGIVGPETFPHLYSTR